MKRCLALGFRNLQQCYEPAPSKAGVICPAKEPQL